VSRRVSVYKYGVPYSTTDEFELRMPKGAKVLSVGVQERFLNGQPVPAWEEIVMWAEVNPDAELTKRFFLAVNTGDEYADEPNRFIGTVTTRGGIVWHVFELLNRGQGG
jgi:hypothetical protein